MVVCLCQGVSEKRVRLAIQKGAATRRQVTHACGAGGACGSCHRTIAEMIREHASCAGAVSAVPSGPADTGHGAAAAPAPASASG